MNGPDNYDYPWQRRRKDSKRTESELNTSELKKHGSGLPNILDKDIIFLSCASGYMSIYVLVTTSNQQTQT
jgi:hypothetical protein